MFTGKQIRDKRKAEGLTAEELAVKLTVSKANLYKWEKGHTPSNPKDYIKIEKWLAGKIENVPPAEPKEPSIAIVIEKQNIFIEILNNTLARQNSLLERQANNIEVRVERTDTNLEQVLHYLQALSMNMKSGREVILRSLARLEKMPESVLVEEASKIVEQIGNLQQDKGQSIGRKDKVP